MSQGSGAPIDLSDPIEPHGIDGCASECGRDLDVVVLPAVVRIFPQRHSLHPVHAVLDPPAVSDVPQQGLGSGPQTWDLVSDLVSRLAITDAMAVHRDDRCAARPLLHHLFRCRYGPEGLSDVSAPFHFFPGGAPCNSAALGEPVSDQRKLPAANVFDGDRDVRLRWARLREKGGWQVARPPALALPQALPPPAAGAGPGSRHLDRTCRRSGRFPLPGSGNQGSPGQ